MGLVGTPQASLPRAGGGGGQRGSVAPNIGRDPRRPPEDGELPDPSPATGGGGRNTIGDYYRNGRWVNTPSGRRFVPNPRGGGGGGGGGAGGRAQATTTAQTNPELTALLGAYKKQLGALESGSGHVLDIAGQKMREAREGGRRGLIEGNIQRGATGGSGLQEYEADTQRGIQGAVTDAALGRESLLNQFILGGTGLAALPGQMALEEKKFGQQVVRDQSQIAAQAAEQRMNAMLALLAASRSSPLQATPAMPTYL